MTQRDMERLVKIVKKNRDASWKIIDALEEMSDTEGLDMEWGRKIAMDFVYDLLTNRDFFEEIAEINGV